jgi:amino acid transporter
MFRFFNLPNNIFSCLNNRYFPFGVDGMVAGSATVFFAYIGFDAVASTAEEV